MIKVRGGQLAARGSHVASQSVFSGPWKHSGKIFKSAHFRSVRGYIYHIELLAMDKVYLHKNSWAFMKTSSVCRNCSYFFYLLYDQLRRYSPPLNAFFSKRPLSQINCPPLI